MTRKSPDGRLLEVSGIDPSIVRDGGVGLNSGAQAAGRGQNTPGAGLHGAGVPGDASQAYAYAYGAPQGPNGAPTVMQPQQGQHPGQQGQHPSQQAQQRLQHPQLAGPGAGAGPAAGNPGPNSGARASDGSIISATAAAQAAGRIGKRRVRLGWTEEETRHLMEGCKRHGVGNWKKILTDPSYVFNCRTAVDLKDRFRTSFPEEYTQLYPNARTHKVKRTSVGVDTQRLIKVNRKERRAFTPEEDDRLLQGFLKHGPAWSKIQRDQSLNLSERRSTDLRDRFRNAFPERYTAAGYKGRAKGAVTTSGPNGGIAGPNQGANGGSADAQTGLAAQAGQQGSTGAGQHPAQSAVQLQAAAQAAQGQHGAGGQQHEMAQGHMGLDDEVALHQQAMMQNGPASAAAARGYMAMQQQPMQFQGMGYPQQPMYFPQMGSHMNQMGQMGQMNQMGSHMGHMNQMSQMGSNVAGQQSMQHNMGSGQINMQQLPPHLQQAHLNTPLNMGNMPVNGVNQMGLAPQQLAQMTQMGAMFRGPQNPQ